MKRALAAFFLLAAAAPALAEVREFNSYFAAMSEMVALPPGTKPQVFYTDDQKARRQTRRIPPEIPGQRHHHGQRVVHNKGLYILVLLDHVTEPVTDISWDTVKHQVLIDTAPDKDAKAPPPEKGKVQFLLEVFVVTPQAGIKSFAIVSQRGRQEVKSEELKAEHVPGMPR